MGKIKAMAHPKAGSKVQRNLVFVITESSVLAALNLNSGEIVWRQTLRQECQKFGGDVQIGKFSIPSWYVP